MVTWPHAFGPGMGWFFMVRACGRNCASHGSQKPGRGESDGERRGRGVVPIAPLKARPRDQLPPARLHLLKAPRLLQQHSWQPSLEHTGFWGTLVQVLALALLGL